MAGKRYENPAGSSSNLRGDVLRVRGVLKRHTDTEKPSERKQARTASHLGALSDLRTHGLAKNGGKISGGDTLRNLTPMDGRRPPTSWGGRAGSGAGAAPDRC
ncbi:hypothetical protein ABZ035_36130, partial [Streptomyces sp. NPDC006334]